MLCVPLHIYPSMETFTGWVTKKTQTKQILFVMNSLIKHPKTFFLHYNKRCKIRRLHALLQTPEWVKWKKTHCSSSRGVFEGRQVSSPWSLLPLDNMFISDWDGSILQDLTEFFRLPVFDLKPWWKRRWKRDEHQNKLSMSFIRLLNAA